MSEPGVQVRLLGPVEITVGEQPVPLTRRTLRAVLAILALRAGRRVAAESLAEQLYGDALPANPRNAVQTQVSLLRRALAAAGASGCIVTEPSGYRLAVDPDRVDVHAFERLLRAARNGLDSGHPAEGLRFADEALGLWRADPLGDLDDRDFAAAVAERLRQLRLDGLETRAELLLDLGRHRDAAIELSTMVDAHPLRERANELLMIALYRSGRQADALRTFDRARSILAEELGVDPGPGLRRAHAAVLGHDPTLDPKTGTRRAREDVTQAEPAQSPVPAPVAGLVGRQAELTTLSALSANTRLLTLTGPGGVGKTRLAVELVRRTGGDAWYVDLGSTSREDDVAAAVARALGLPVLPGQDPLASASARLGDGTLLLDTCEHLVEAAAHAAVRVLERCPNLRVVATSRRPLLVRGEIAWPTPPLSLPASTDATSVGAADAVRYFVSRAAAARPGFALTADNAAVVAAICASLDGLPLALELAAARLDVLPLSGLQRELVDPFRTLTNGPRDASERHQSLRATLEWSMGMLSKEELRMFRRLAVVPGSFGLDLVLEMGTDQSDPVATLSSLVHHSVLGVGEGERFRMLDTLRDYAGRDAGTETAFANRQLARWARGLATSTNVALHGPEQVVAIETLRREAPNLRAALEWALGGASPGTGVAIASHLAWYWYLVGDHADAYRWLSAGLVAPEGDPPDRVGLLVGAGVHAMALGQLRESIGLLTEAVASARELGESTLEAFAMANLGSSQWAGGDLESAATTLDAVIHGDSAPDDPGRWVVTYASALRARVAIDAGRDGKAGELLETARVAVDDLADDHLIALVGRLRARLVLATDPSAALGLALDAVRRNERLGHSEGTALALQVAGEAHRRLGRAEKAAALIRRSLGLTAAADHAIGMCHALELLAACQVDLGNPASAESLLAAATQARSELDLPRTPTERRFIAQSPVGSGPPRLVPEHTLGRAEARARLWRAATAVSDGADLVHRGEQRSNST